ncbi:MAG: M48 family metalloprotease [Proteobacteria bacterium]|nr:M48 family metalloprotease [Pseudomonadota bacterium]
MFKNFIYFIFFVLIYSTNTYSEAKGNGISLENVFLFFGLAIIFSCISYLKFKKLEKSILYESIRFAEHKFESLSTQLLILAIFLFAINIYWFALPSYTQKISLFRSAPTFEALLFICLFVSYLSIVWACSYGAYQKLYPSDEMSRRSYITSNISFGVPVILPWLLLSVIIDIINNLPFDGPKNFLSTTFGELAFVIFFLFIIAITGPVMILKIWRCKPLEQGEHRFLIEEMCNRAGVKFSEILYWPLFGNRMITAGVMGLAKRFRYILVTKPLLRVLDPDEVKTVIAHEIGHVKRHHLAFYLLFFLGYIIVSFSVLDLILYAGIYAKPAFLFLSGLGVEYSTVISISSGILIIAIFLVYFRFIFAYFMRNFERQADAYVYSFFTSAKPLISAFQKISYISGQPPDKPNWHHFSIKERIEYLYKCEDDKSWIKRQDRKIQKSIAVYLVCLIITGVIGYNLNFGESSKRIKIFFSEKIILGLIQDNPDDQKFPAMLGDLYYSINLYEKAKNAYKQSLSIDSKNPEVLNNLAWLYATCEDKNIRNANLAIIYAEAAVKKEKAPHTLDTLAQSYFVAGRYKDAVEAGRKALSMAGKDKQYYEKQLAKFTDHLQMGR